MMKEMDSLIAIEKEWRRRRKEKANIWGNTLAHPRVNRLNINSIFDHWSTNITLISQR